MNKKLTKLVEEANALTLSVLTGSDDIGAAADDMNRVLNELCDKGTLDGNRITYPTNDDNWEVTVLKTTNGEEVLYTALRPTSGEGKNIKFTSLREPGTEGYNIITGAIPKLAEIYDTYGDKLEAIESDCSFIVGGHDILDNNMSFGSVLGDAVVDWVSVNQVKKKLTDKGAKGLDEVSSVDFIESVDTEHMITLNFDGVIASLKENGIEFE